MGRQDVLSQDEETPAITCCQADQCWGEVGGQGKKMLMKERSVWIDWGGRETLATSRSSQLQGGLPVCLRSSSPGSRTTVSRTRGW